MNEGIQTKKTSIRLNMTVDELIKLTGAAPVVIGQYRGCSGANNLSRIDQKTGRPYELHWVTHFVEVQADGVFDQLRIMESLVAPNPDYKTPYKVNTIYMFPIAKYTTEKGGKDCRTTTGKPAIELKGEVC